MQRSNKHFIKSTLFWSRQKCQTKATRVLHKRHECDTSADERQEWKILILITARVKTYFCSSTLATWEFKDGEEQFHFKNYFLKMLHSRAKMRLKSAPQKNELCNGKSYIKKLYTTLYLQMPLHVPGKLSIVRQPRFC